MLSVLILFLIFAGAHGAPSVAVTGTQAGGEEVAVKFTVLTASKDNTITFRGATLGVYTTAADGVVTKKTSTTDDTLGGRAAITSPAASQLTVTITLECGDDGMEIKLVDADSEEAKETFAFTKNFVPTALVSPANFKVGDNIDIYALVCGSFADNTVISVTCGSSNTKLGKLTVKAATDLVSTTSTDMDTDDDPAIGKSGESGVTTLTSQKTYYKVAVKAFQSTDNEKECKFTAGSTTDIAKVTLEAGSSATSDTSALTCGFSLVLVLAVASKELIFA